MLLFRSLMFVPGNRKNMLEKATAFDADFVVPDLEDSVPVSEKDNARTAVREMVPVLASHNQRIIVRINSRDTGLTEKDIEAVASDELYGISVGKVESVEDVKYYDELLSQAEAHNSMQLGTLKLVLWIENAKAVLYAYQICRASPRVVAATFGAEDYTRDMGIQRSESGDELFFPRATVALGARAAGVVPLDTPYVKFRDIPGLEQDIRAVLRLGYKGKFAIHPVQLEPVNRLFGPQPDEVVYARKVVQAWDKAAAEGRGSIDLDGVMIDMPVVKRARDLLALAEAIARRRKSQ
jgi:citrate lyase subunit beta/citryl-CoA lyase